MQFCPACDNKLHMEIGQMVPQQGAPDAFSMPLTLYCKHCPYRKSMNQTSTEGTTANDQSHTFDPCMYRSNYSSNHPLYYENVVNQYTFDDPTLPVLSDGQCMNPKCVCNTDASVDPEILYVRYNDQDLKFLYLCRHCRQCWHHAEVGGQRTNELLFDFGETAPYVSTPVAVPKSAESSAVTL